MAAVRGAVPGRARHPAARRDGGLRRGLVLRARRGAAIRGHRDLRRRAAQRGDGLHPGVARRGRGGGAARDVGRRTRRSFATASGSACPAAELVPGDIVLIEEGDTIPADARVVESTALQTAEAALTGESLPVSKDADADRGRRRRSATGRTWCSAARPRRTGAGMAVVTATGMRTEMGRIAGMLQDTRERADAAAARARSHRQAARASSSSPSPS